MPGWSNLSWQESNYHHIFDATYLCPLFAHSGPPAQLTSPLRAKSGRYKFLLGQPKKVYDLYLICILDYACISINLTQAY